MADRLRRDPGLVLLIVAVAAAVAVYAPSLGYGLVNYDDPWLVKDNWIVQDASVASLHAIFFDLDTSTRFVLGYEYLPVRDVSMMLDFAIWGDAWSGFHATNVAIYAASIAAWFAALAAFGIDRKIAGIAALLWALHPAHAESVAWITERKGLLAVLFAGACALAYARFRAGRSGRWLVLAALAAAFAVWSKASGAFAVAALAGLELVLPARRASWRRSATGLGVIALVAGAAFVPVLVTATEGSIVGAAVELPAGRTEMVLGVHGFYLRAGALAVEHAVSYPLASHGPGVLDLIAGGLGFAALLASFAVKRTPPEVRAGAILWLFGWLAVGHVITPLKMVIVADRYLLFPSLGLALAAAAGIARIPSVRGRYALVGALAIASTFRTLAAETSWRDSHALWASAVASNPADGAAWGMYVDAVAGRGGDADAALARALAHARSPRLVHRQALRLLATDRAAALELFREAAGGGETIAMSNLALLLLETGQLEEALRWARTAAGARPTAHAQRTHGKVALAAGHAEEALAAFERALRVEPSCANHFNVALALVQLGRPGALPNLDRCIGDPELGERARELRSRAR